MDRTCNECGQTSWNQILEDEYTGHKHPSQRDTLRRKRVYTCEHCGAEARKFDKGPSGAEVHAGAAR